MKCEGCPIDCCHSTINDEWHTDSSDFSQDTPDACNLAESELRIIKAMLAGEWKKQCEQGEWNEYFFNCLF